MNENLIVQEAERREKLTGFTELVSKSRVRSAYGIGFIEGAEWISRQNQWISVEDSLPEYEKDNPTRYIIRVESGSIERKYTFTLGWLRNRYKWNVEMDWVRVTHWMPIPPFNNEVNGVQ